MASSELDHPSTELLQAFVRGQLGECEAPTVEAHVASCETCLEQLDELTHAPRPAPPDRCPPRVKRFATIRAVNDSRGTTVR